jgi:hypothetical protein
MTADVRMHGRGVFAIGVIAALFALAIACGESATEASVPVAAEPTAPVSSTIASQPPADPDLVNTPVPVSNEAPDFTLPSIQGSEYTLSSFQGEQPVLVVFYRAYW